MSVTLDIARVRLGVRLAGHVEDAVPLERRLNDCLAGEVLSRVGDALSLGGDDGVYCIDRLALKVAMTLDDAMAPAGAALWADRLAAALAARLTAGEGVWRYANRPAFLAGWVRMRLGLGRVPRRAFGAMDALAHLSPAQALAELPLSEPALWRWLASDPEVPAARVAHAARAALGTPGLAAVLVAALENEAAVEPNAGESPDLAALIDELAPAGGVPVPVQGPVADLEAVFALALALAARDEPRFVRGALLVALADAARAASASPARSPIPAPATEVTAALSEGLPPPLRPALAKLAARIEGNAAARDAFGRLVVRRGSTPGAADTPDTPWGPHADRRPTTMPNADPASASSAAATATVDAIASPIAGAGLLIPFLAENGIGLGYSPAERRAALALCVGRDTVERPEDDPLVMVLCGADEPAPDHARPNRADLLFVATERQARIEAAQPGPDRLATWLEARLAAQLPGLGRSSRDFLRRQFLARPGHLVSHGDRLRLTLAPIELSVVLDLGGQIGRERARPAWLGRRPLDIAWDLRS